jgi:hypothetical protein
VASATAPALAGDQDFNLVNKTGYQIDEVYLGPVSSNSWGEDIMGKGALGDGETAAITFTAPNSVCQWDMKVKYNDGDTAEWRNLNLCNTSKISLYWDKNAGTTRAVTD